MYLLATKHSVIHCKQTDRHTDDISIMPIAHHTACGTIG